MVLNKHSTANQHPAITECHYRMEYDRRPWFAIRKAAANQQPANKQMSTTGSKAKQANSTAARCCILQNATTVWNTTNLNGSQ